MNSSITVVEAKSNFAEWMNRVAYQGERVIVERHGKPLMAWISMSELARLEALGSASDLRQQRQNALAQANAVRERIRNERLGVPVPDSSEILNDLRDGRTNDTDLR